MAVGFEVNDLKRLQTKANLEKTSSVTNSSYSTGSTQPYHEVEEDAIEQEESESTAIDGVSSTEKNSSSRGTLSIKQVLSELRL